MFRVNAVLAGRVLSFLACLLGGCAPVFSDFQSAGTVGKEQIELTPAYASIFITEETYRDQTETKHVQHNVGARLDVGLNDRLDLQFAGALLFLGDQGSEGESISPVRVVSVGPKFGLIPGILATAIPVGFASFPNGNDLHWAVHPTLFLSYPFGQLEITNSAKVLIPLASSYETLLAFNWGAGWSHKPEQWKLRPEVGLMVNPGESGLFWSAGIGFSYRIKGEVGRVNLSYGSANERAGFWFWCSASCVNLGLPENVTGPLITLEKLAGGFALFAGSISGIAGQIVKGYRQGLVSVGVELEAESAHTTG